MVLMPRPKDNKNKTSTGTSRAYSRKGGAADVQKAITASSKKFDAMSPAQKKAYIAKQAKAIGKTTVQVASMVGGANLARKGGVVAARKLVPAKKVKLDQSINKMKNVLGNSKGPARTTRASQPTTELEKNIGRHSALRKKFPNKFKP
jgi:hypothetical protein